MTINLNPRQLAIIIAEAVRAQVGVAMERGECTPANLDAIVRAAGNGAAQAIANLDTSDE